MYCTKCGKEVDESTAVCPECGFKLKETAFCRNCGKEISIDAVICPSCGVPTDKFTAAQQAAQPQAAQPQIIINNDNNNVNTNVNYNRFSGRDAPHKSKIVALILSILLGYLGIHRFYVGKIGTGFVWFFTGGLFGIGWIVDIILIAVGLFRDKYGYKLV